MIGVAYEAYSRHAVAVDFAQCHDRNRQDERYAPRDQLEVYALFVYPILYLTKRSETHVPGMHQYDKPYHRCH